MPILATESEVIVCWQHLYLVAGHMGLATVILPSLLILFRDEDASD